jgi:hypothetical protein
MVLLAYRFIVLTVFVASAMDSSFIVIVPGEMSVGRTSRNNGQEVRVGPPAAAAVRPLEHRGQDDKGMVEEDSLIVTSVECRTLIGHDSGVAETATG